MGELIQPWKQVTDAEVTQALCQRNVLSQRCQVALEHKLYFIMYATVHLPTSIHHFCRFDSVLV